MSVHLIHLYSKMTDKEVCHLLHTASLVITALGFVVSLSEYIEGCKKQ